MHCSLQQSIPRQLFRLSHWDTSVFQTESQTHSSLLQHIWPLKKFSGCFSYLRWTYQKPICTQTERRGSELIRLSDHYNSTKTMTESHIFVFENELIKFLSVGKRIKLNLDLSGEDSLLNRDSRHSQIYPSDETFFNYWSHLRYATHILSLPVGVCVCFEPCTSHGCVLYQEILLYLSLILIKNISSVTDWNRGVHKPKPWFRACESCMSRCLWSKSCGLGQRSLVSLFFFLIYALFVVVRYSRTL